MGAPQEGEPGRRRRRGWKRPSDCCWICGSERGAAPSGALPLGDRLPLVLLLEALDPPGGVQEPLLPREEGVALGAHLHLDGRHGGAGVDDFPAVAGDRRINVVRMNASLHGAPPRWISEDSRLAQNWQSSSLARRSPLGKAPAKPSRANPKG